ncbi:MAG: spore maturation protein [Acidobacteriota bacterium]|jgi:spore maturation protein B|nr:spore maturation protein [Acidobacteriota bacterium]NLT31901.1 spore maturation protein [Acidobacteriota bacterium]
MMQQIIGTLSAWAIPLFLVAIPLYGVARGVKVYESFVEGAKGGFQTAIRIIPYLVAILVAVGMLRAAGAIEMLSRGLDPLLARLHFPAEILPLALMRPLSGSGSLGIVTELIQVHGPDSLLGRLAATAYGSTETTFYVLAVYFGAVGIKKVRHAVFAGLVADVVSIVAAITFCRLAFA